MTEILLTTFNVLGEIRNEIYRLVLVFSRAVSIEPSIHGQRSLLQTCQQIHEEATMIYYNQNAFFISSCLTGIHNITGFLYSKDVGKMVGILIFVHTLDDEQKTTLQDSMIFTDSFMGILISLDPYDKFTDMVVRDAKAVADEILRAGVPESSSIVFKQRHEKASRIEARVDDLRILFDTELRSAVSMSGLQCITAGLCLG